MISAAAHAAALQALAGQQLGQHVGQLLQRARLHAAERGDPQDHVVAQAVREEAQHFGRLLAVQVDQDGSDDLRVLVLDQLGHRGGVHPVQGVDAAARIARFQDVLDHGQRAFLAQRLVQHALDERAGVHVQRQVLLGLAAELGQHLGHFLARHRRQVGHRRTQPLHFTGRQMLENLGGSVLANRHHQDGALLQALFGHSLTGVRHGPSNS
jgi:hypothetical protein